MHLVPQRARIYAFKSIYGETVVPLRPGLQFLIGRNGSGKSSILQAIALIRPGAQIPPFWIPKFLTQTQRMELEQTQETEIVSVDFELATLEQGSETVGIPSEVSQITMAVKTKGQREFRTNLGELPRKSEHLLETILNTADRINEFLSGLLTRGDLSQHLSGPIRQLQELLENDPEGVDNAKFQNVVQLLVSLGLNQESANLSEIWQDHDSAVRRFLLPPEWIYSLEKYIPPVTFVPSRYELADRFSLNEAQSATEGPLLSARKLLKLADLSPSGLQGLDERERQQIIHQGNETLERVLNEHWTQEALSIYLSVTQQDEVIVSLRESTGAFVAPSEASEGLRWFLPFFINLIVDIGNEWKNAIILVDDPGVYLHLEAQKEVRDLLVKLAQENTVLVASHSPAILSLEDTSRIYVVEKRPESDNRPTGTDVLTPKQSGWQDRAVVRAAIGMTVGDTMFGNRVTLIVEGPSDRLYIEGGLRTEQVRSQIDVEPEQVGVLAAMGADNIERFANWCYSEKRKFAVILDNDSKGRGRKKKLEAMGLSDNAILVTGPYVRDGVSDSTIEDVIDSEIFDRIAAKNSVAAGAPVDEINALLEEQPVNQMNTTRVNNALTVLRGKRQEVDKLGVAAAYIGEMALDLNSDQKLKDSVSRLSQLIVDAVSQAT